jgi:hypothetical protein
MLKQQGLDGEALGPDEPDPADHWPLSELSGFDPHMPVFKTLISTSRGSKKGTRSQEKGASRCRS